MKKSLMVVAVVAVLLMASLVFAASYSDVPANSIYAPAVEALTKAKIMVGSNGLFNGSATVNRYQLAETAYKLLNYIESDPLLAKAQDITALQTVINSVVKKVGNNDAIVATLQKEVNSLKVIVDEVKGTADLAKIVANNSDSINTLQNLLVDIKTSMESKVDSASANADKALKFANINNTMIANQAKEIASLKQDMKALKAASNNDELMKVKGELEAEINQTVAFIYKKISVATKPIADNTKAIDDLKGQLKDLKKTVNDNYVALNTSVSSVRSSLSNEISFVKNDLKTTKAQLSSEISNNKVALEQEINNANNKANIAMWTGVAGIAVGAISFGTFLYWVWNYSNY
jgi:hypothetical protein